MTDLPTDLVSLREWSRRLRVPGHRLRAMSLAGDFPLVYDLGHGLYRVSDSAAQAWLESRDIHTTTRAAQQVQSFVRRHIQATGAARRRAARRGRAAGGSA